LREVLNPSTSSGQVVDGFDVVPVERYKYDNDKE
jgi:hypothetical protein